jgi:hypothetical protein
MVQHQLDKEQRDLHGLPCHSRPLIEKPNYFLAQFYLGLVSRFFYDIDLLQAPLGTAEKWITGPVQDETSLAKSIYMLWRRQWRRTSLKKLQVEIGRLTWKNYVKV